MTVITGTGRLPMHWNNGGNVGGIFLGVMPRRGKCLEGNVWIPLIHAAATKYRFYCSCNRKVTQLIRIIRTWHLTVWQSEQQK